MHTNGNENARQDEREDERENERENERDSALAIAILAAGASRRLGQPKQLLRIGGDSLLQRAVDTAHALGGGRVLLLLGAQADACWASLRPGPNRDRTERVDVPGYAEGMSASVRAAASCVDGDPAIARLLVMLVDQHAVDIAWLRQLRALGAAYPQRMVASVHEGVRGAPAVFPRSEFPALRNLSGDFGARALLRARGDTVEFRAPHAPGDIDTPEDLPSP
jgi:CTP:molybdopterin cytidylyltransferase MocA